MHKAQRERSEVTGEWGGITTLKRREAVSHGVESVWADAETLQVTEVRLLLHLDTHVGNARLLEQCRHLPADIHNKPIN